MSVASYAEHAINQTTKLMKEISEDRDGSPRNLPGDVTAGVLLAQSNLAIAAALLVVAEAVRGRS